MSAVRVISGLAAALLVGLAQPALAECIGKYPNMTCVSNSGDVWTPQGYGSSGSYYRSGGSKLSKYPNGSAAGPGGQPAANSNTSGKTIVLQPSAQTGNARILTPQSSGGATVLRGSGSGGAAVCLSGGSC
jgi:hypothetical protein